MTPTKDPAESVVVAFDFAAELTSITSATVAVSVHGPGVDPNVAAMLEGAHQISGSTVLQRVRGGVAPLEYMLRCVATRGSDVIVRAGVMPVRQAAS